MPKPVQRTIFFLVFFLLGSCEASAQEKNKPAQDFINRIDSTLTSFISAGENFAAYFQLVGPAAEQDPDYKLSRNRIDSLKGYYKSYLNSMAEGISKLTALGEFDSALKLVTPLIYFLKKTKAAYSSTFPSYFKIYQLGWDKARDKDKLILVDSPKMLREANLSLSKELRHMSIMIEEFNRKYGLNNK